jgi:hypothetical protein
MKQRSATQGFKRSFLVTAIISALNSTVVNAQEENTVAQNDDKSIE